MAERLFRPIRKDASVSEARNDCDWARRISDGLPGAFNRRGEIATLALELGVSKVPYMTVIGAFNRAVCRCVLMGSSIDRRIFTDCCAPKADGFISYMRDGSPP